MHVALCYSCCPFLQQDFVQHFYLISLSCGNWNSITRCVQLWSNHTDSHFHFPPCCLKCDPTEEEYEFELNDHAWFSMLWSPLTINCVMLHNCLFKVFFLKKHAFLADFPLSLQPFSSVQVSVVWKLICWHTKLDFCFKCCLVLQHQPLGKRSFNSAFSLSIDIESIAFISCVVGNVFTCKYNYQSCF